MNVDQLKIPELSLRYLKAAKYVAELRSVTRAGEQLIGRKQQYPRHYRT